MQDLYSVYGDYGTPFLAEALYTSPAGVGLDWIPRSPDDILNHLRQQQVVPVCSHANCTYEIEESKTGWKVTVNCPLGSPWWNLLLPREMYFQAIEYLQQLLSVPGIDDATVIVTMMNESDPWGDLQLAASLTREEAQCVQLKLRPPRDLARTLIHKWHVGLRGEDVPKPMSEEVEAEILRRAARDAVLITDIQRSEQGWSIEAQLVDNSSAWRL